MKYLHDDDTIVALSTPMGKGAIAVVRMSGPGSLEIVNRLFSKPVSARVNRQAQFGRLTSPADAELIDEAVVTYFQAPGSYTGEDVVEISCHNNPLIIERLLAALIDQGARAAGPGEFTLRAFLSRKMDLSQAEAVAGIIDARTRRGLSLSLRQLEGGLSARIAEIKQRVLEIASYIEVNLDFNEDDIDVYEPAALEKKAQRVLAQIDSLISSYHYGRLLSEGLRMVLLGKPNAGKSSLLNALLNRDRAIVSAIPGTTRDYIEEQMEIDGIPVQVVDTAGVRETMDPIEEMGVKKALQHVKSADVVLAIFDASGAIDGDDRRLLAYLQQVPETTPVVIVLNKADRGLHSGTVETLRGRDKPGVVISAKTGENLGALKARIRELVLSDGEVENEDVVVTRARHRAALEQARAAVIAFRDGLSAGMDEAVLAGELRSALDYLGEVVGETTSEDVLNHIFGQFCIGK